MLPTGTSSITDRAEQCIKALRARGHANPTRYTFVDSATNVNMSSSCANAIRVDPMPAHERPEVAGVSGGVEQTHHVYRAVPPALRMPGSKDTHRTMWSANNVYDITSTDTLAELGLDVFTVSAEDGQMYLSPSGLDPRDERTRTKCERVSGLQALPTRRRPEPTRRQPPTRRHVCHRGSPCPAAHRLRHPRAPRTLAPTPRPTRQPTTAPQSRSKDPSRMCRPRHQSHSATTHPGCPERSGLRCHTTSFDSDSGTCPTMRPDEQPRGWAFVSSAQTITEGGWITNAPRPCRRLQRRARSPTPAFFLELG